jgi:hypothetical protein
VAALAAGSLSVSALDCNSARARGGQSKGSAGQRAQGGSPLDSFRQMLAMSPEERKMALESKPESQREFLEGKLREYDAFAPDERELRLRVTQLRFYLTPLLYKRPDERASKLDAIPSEDRALVQERLAQWDKLPREVQREVRDNEWLVQTVVRFQSATPAQQKAQLESMSASRRERLERDLAKWNGFAADKRQRMLANFNQFFELNEKEKARILKSVPGIERAQIERTIAAFQKLPPEQRTMCMDALKKFSSMTTEQQLQFLSNADRWAKLSDAEKDLIRKMVTQMPPLPPGFGESIVVPPSIAGPKKE